MQPAMGENVGILGNFRSTDEAIRKRKKNRRFEDDKCLSSRIFTDCGPKYGKTEIVNISDKIWRNATIGEFP
jgi:hypothetical protein